MIISKLLPQTQKSRGEIDCHTDVMDHDVKNLGEEVFTHTVMLNVTHLVRASYETVIYAIVTIDFRGNDYATFPIHKHLKCKLRV